MRMVAVWVSRSGALESMIWVLVSKNSDQLVTEELAPISSELDTYIEELGLLKVALRIPTTFGARNRVFPILSPRKGDPCNCGGVREAWTLPIQESDV